MVLIIPWTVAIFCISFLSRMEGSRVCEVNSFAEAIYDGGVITAAPGTILTLRCKDPYEEGFPTTTCQDGRWTEPRPPCKLVECPYPGYPRHGELNMPCRYFDCTSTYSCVEGYWYTGESATITCRRDNTWSGAVGTCDGVQCPPLVDPHGDFHPRNWSYHAVSTLWCDEGFIYEDSTATNYRCLGDKKWDSTVTTCIAVVCPKLPEPENGHIQQSNRSYLAVAEVECDEGYNYSKPEYKTRQCQGNNTWTGDEGTCERISCSNIENGHNGIITTNSGRYKDTITLQCYSGHTLNGPWSVTCLSSGKWSSELGSCSPGWKNFVFMTVIPIVGTCLLVLLVGIGIGCVVSKRKMRRNMTEEGRSNVDESVSIPLLETSTSAHPKSEYTDSLSREAVTPSLLNARFYINEDFSDEYPDETSGQYMLFMSMMEEGIKAAITKGIGVVAEGLKVVSISKGKRRVFLKVLSSETLTSERLVDAIKGASLSNGRGGRTYTVVKDTINVIDEITNILKQTVLIDRHKVDRPDDKRVDFEKEYVPLRLTCSDNMIRVQRDSLERIGNRYQKQGNDGSEDINDQQILDDGESGKLILVRGRAGVGKSTLMQRLAWLWANGDLAERFKAIFLLNMRGFLGNTNEMELYIFLCFYSLYGTPETTVSSAWLNQNSKYICIMLDGLDEIGRFSDHLKQTANKSQKDTPMHWCFRLLSRKVLTDATIIVCSRPLPDLTLIQPSKVVEVLGLDRKGVFDYIRKNVQQESQTKVKQSIVDNPILHSVCAITYYCQALCGVLDEDDLPQADLKNLTTYTQIMAYIIEKSVRRSLKNEYSDVDMYEDTYSSALRLAQLAYHGIQSTRSTGVRKLVFTKEDLEHAEVQQKDVQQMVKAGLLVQYEVQENGYHADRRIATEFAHLSIQEFWAMRGLISDAPEKKKECVQWMASSGNFNMALLFLCGLAINTSDASGNISNSTVTQSQTETTPEKTTEMLSEIMLSEIVPHIRNELQVLQMIHESQSPKVAQVVGEQRFPERVSVKGHQSLTLIDVRAITFLLQHHPTTHTLSIKNANLDVTSIREIARFLQDNASLKHINITDRTVNDGFLAALMSGVKQNKGLQTLELSCGNISQKGVGDIADAILDNKTLKEAWLKNLCLMEKGAEAILEALSENTAVSVWVASIDCRNEEIKKQLEENDRITIIR